MLIKIPETSDRKCDSCGMTLSEGELFYHCRTEIIADKAQTPLELKYPDQLIAQALSELEFRGEQEILDDIYREIILQLCPKCCTIFIQRIHGMINSGKICTKCQSEPPMEKKGKVLPFFSKKNPPSTD